MNPVYAGAIGFIVGAAWMYAIAHGVIREMERWWQPAAPPATTEAKP